MMGDLWPVSYGQLYPTLRKLSDEQFVTMETRQGKKAVEKNVYSITEEGRKVFKRWLEKEKKRVQHSIKDEFTLSFFFLDRMSRETVIPVLETKLRETNESYEVYRREYERMENGAPGYRRLLTRKMLLHLEAEKQWLSEVIEEFADS
jgi:DNA-binding PadR family transcriptional regulator